MTLSRFHFHPCGHADASNVAAWHGWFGSRPKTGTVHVELEEGSEPKKYCVPSVVVIFQYSWLYVPFSTPYNRSTREPSSDFGRHFSWPGFDESSLISGPPPEP